MQSIPTKNQAGKKPKALADGARKRQKIGIILTIIAGVSWGFSGNCAQYLFQNSSLQPMELCVIRMLFSGLILIVPVLATNLRSGLRTLLTTPRDVLQLILYAFLGMVFNQYAYLMAIKFTNSGTATVIQYLSPVLIMAASCVMMRRLPRAMENIALVLTVVGVFLIATHGNVHTLYITPKGLAWGLLAAVGMVLYTMLPVPLIRKYGSIPVMACALLIGAAGMIVSTRFWNFRPHGDWKYYLILVLIVLIGTVLAFTTYLLGIEYCGAVKASMIASVEPVSSTIIMVVWLGEPIYLVEIIGFICIILTIFLLAGKEPE